MRLAGSDARLGVQGPHRRHGKDENVSGWTNEFFLQRPTLLTTKPSETIFFIFQTHCLFEFERLASHGQSASTECTSTIAPQRTRGIFQRFNGVKMDITPKPRISVSRKAGMVVQRVESAPAVHSVYCGRLAVGIAIPRRQTSHSTKRLSDRRRLLF
ncbi:hypothetical protein D3C84_936760 [compost metagenome]